jgi:hypothetical protein
MKDCNKDIENYHSDKVKLPRDKCKELTDRRDANRTRVKDGLERAGDPQPEEFVTQGSRAMDTTTQEPDNAYDIDDGAVFAVDALVSGNSAEKTALDARKMVRDAVDDGSFKTKPEVRKNCVRVYYNDGPHVDIPVYRKKKDGTKELASVDWKISDPDGVNKWFKDAATSKIGANAPEQMRTDIRLIKNFCINRPSYSLPSGFTLTVLVNEAYSVSDDRLDRSFRNVLIAIHRRLCTSLEVRHPVVNEWLTDGPADPKTSQLRALLQTAINDLAVLDRANCLRSEALKAWKKVFNTDYFDEEIENAEADEKRQSIAVVTGLTYVAKPWCG